MRRKLYLHPSKIKAFASDVDEGLSAIRLLSKYFSNSDVGYQYVKILVRGYKKSGVQCLIAPGIGPDSGEELYTANKDYLYSGSWPNGVWTDYNHTRVFSYEDIVSDYKKNGFRLKGEVFVPTMAELLKAKEDSNAN